MATSKKPQIQTQIQSQIQRRGSSEGTIKITDPIMHLIEEVGKIRQEMRELRQEMKEDLRGTNQEIRGEIKETREEIRKDFKKELDNFGKKMEKMTSDIKTTQKEVEKIKERTVELENTSRQILKKQEQQQFTEWNNEMRYRDRCIKIRGLPEKSNENLAERLIPDLAKYMGLPVETMDQEIDKLFRVNSIQAREKKIPRDIVTCLVRTKIRDQIIQKNFEEKFIVEDQEIKIFKDLPPQILAARLKYKTLTQILKHLNINYRWERIEGLSFYYNQKRYRIDNEEKAREMEKKLRRESREKEDKNKEKTTQPREWRPRYNKEKKHEEKEENNTDIEEEERIDNINPKEQLRVETISPSKNHNLLFDFET
ncbi:uncharacterized protein PF11_0207-like [Sceloporus undulatus]|uniref:uncharacterized protein PF11_0207-like n=1 Tax=Sceloporus undulatus TaxID=8520 RepID=UPI001C4BE861|nr:uncharacterized protein PF11_0207-like [Sceloporus undulatus]